jgi:hypothetical protein
MNQFVIFLDGPFLGGLAAIGFLFVVLPIAAILLLIFFF